jgi:hypothetical protein
MVANPTLSATQSELQTKSAARSRKMRETCPYSAIFHPQTGLQRTDCPSARGPPSRLFSGGHMRSPVSRRAVGECKAIRKPMKRRSPGFYSFVHKAVFTAIAKYGHYSRISAQSERKFSAVQTFTLHGGSEQDSSSVRIGRLHGGQFKNDQTLPFGRCAILLNSWF